MASFRWWSTAPGIRGRLTVKSDHGRHVRRGWRSAPRDAWSMNRTRCAGAKGEAHRLGAWCSGFSAPGRSGEGAESGRGRNVGKSASAARSDWQLMGSHPNTSAYSNALGGIPGSVHPMAPDQRRVSERGRADRSHQITIIRTSMRSVLHLDHHGNLRGFVGLSCNTARGTSIDEPAAGSWLSRR